MIQKDPVQLKRVVYPCRDTQCTRIPQNGIHHEILWIIYRYGSLCVQPWQRNSYKCVIEKAYCCEIIGVATIWMCNLSFSILSLLTFVMEMWGIVPEINTCWTYAPSLFRNCLIMAPWCRNMQQLAPYMKCVL